MQKIGNTIWPQALDFQNSPNQLIFGIFNELLSTQNANSARFARNDEWDFFCDFQTLCKNGALLDISSLFSKSPIVV